MTDATEHPHPVHVAVYDGLADWEVGHLTAHVNDPSWQRTPGRYQIVTVAERAGVITTMGGMRIVPDTTIGELLPPDSSMLVLPGAETWLTGGNAAFVELAGELLAAGTPVAAICGATVGLAAGGLLDDRRHTSNAPEALAATQYGGGHLYVDEPAVTDRGLVTASGTAPVEFARAAFALLELYEPRVLASWYKLFGLNDPAGYFELVAAAS